MNIAIDITPLSTGHSGRGVGIYTKYLVESLQQYGKQHSYTLFTRGQNVPVNVDLVHYPYFDPFFLTLPFWKSKPAIVTVHDLIPLVFPDKFPKGIRGSIKWQIQKLSLFGAKRIITDSVNSKKDIVQITGFSSDNIDVVRLAPSPAFYADILQDRLDEIKKKYSLPKRFVTYVGDVNWNKNILNLISAFATLKKSRGVSDVRLILVGKSFFNNGIAEVREIQKLIKTLHLENSVAFSGYVSDEDLAGMYRLATCLVQPSYYEGFGLPVLEAMASGCPVVCSDTSSLAEISGPAISMQPDNLQSIITGIRRCITLTPRQRSSAIEKGREWSKRFTWKKTAEETIQTYEKIDI